MTTPSGWTAIGLGFLVLAIGLFLVAVSFEWATDWTFRMVADSMKFLVIGAGLAIYGIYLRRKKQQP